MTRVAAAPVIRPRVPAIALICLGALLVVSALACLLGRALLRFVPLHYLHYVGSAVCVLMAGLTAYDLWA